MNEHYNAVLADMRVRRSTLEAEMKELDLAISAIQRIAAAHIPSASAPFAPAATASIPTPGGIGIEAARHRFTNISVRWAVLWHLAEFAHGDPRTGEIAQAIKDGGYNTEATNFGNMVSAVLSAMKTKGEVESSEDGSGYRLTDAGRKTWELIKQGGKFRATMSADESPLLLVQ